MPDTVTTTLQPDPDHDLLVAELVAALRPVFDAHLAKPRRQRAGSLGATLRVFARAAHAAVDELVSERIQRSGA